MTMQEICERKVMPRKIKHCGSLSTNVTIGYCAGYCMNTSLVTKKPAKYVGQCMPTLDKNKRKSELL